MSDELVKRLREDFEFESSSRARVASAAADLIEQQAAKIAALEAQTATVAPAVDAQPVEIYQVQMADDSWMDVSHEDLLDLRPEETTRTVYASAQSWGLRKDAEELLRRIPTTPEQMIDFIGSHFDSMEAQEWSEFSGEARAKPAGDLSMVRYSLTVHDLLSAFDWADLSEYAIDAALSQHTGEQS
jgi:hypothetical protein